MNLVNFVGKGEGEYVHFAEVLLNFSENERDSRLEPLLGLPTLVLWKFTTSTKFTPETSPMSHEGAMQCPAKSQRG